MASSSSRQIDFFSAVIFLMCGFVVLVESAQMFDCPLGWESHANHCYRFTFYPHRDFNEGVKACQVDGAYLISVNTKPENTFISRWLTQHDNNKGNKWLTSGRSEGGQSLKWTGDATVIDPSPDLWVGNSYLPVAKAEVVVYQYTVQAGTFQWTKDSVKVQLPYICEIPLSEAYRIVQHDRDETYGRDILDVRLIPRGPSFVQQPKTIVVIEPTVLKTDIGEVRPQRATLECRVVSNPESSYIWYKDFIGQNQTVINSMTDQRYTVTNGKLIINKPSEKVDFGTYRCTATNGVGSIVSDPAQINFGFLSEFSNDPRGAVNAKMFRGAVLNCNPPTHNPEIVYQWYKTGGPVYFLRFDINPHMFLSRSGKLYFSEVDSADAGLYHCIIYLVAPVNQVLSTRQNNRKSSLGIQLNINGGAALDYGPAIHKDFPTVFPKLALWGHTLRLECFAFGKLPIYYTWKKDGGAVPNKSYTTDFGRVLVLPDAELEDSGNYSCQAKRDTSRKSIKTLHLKIEAAPFFNFPLRDQHIDSEQPFTWRCECLGLPNPIYTWYKNAVPLSSSSSSDGIIVKRNILTILKTNKEKHEGMYQCEAKNAHGTRTTSAHLRIVAFAPSFFKRPMNPSQVASIGGSVTILCQPEASPPPSVKWLINGRTLPLITNDKNSRIWKLKNGNLLLQNLQPSDIGNYTCIASNTFGEASSSGHLHLVPRTIISVAPTNDRVHINGTVFLPCLASFDKRIKDLVYTWQFYGTVLDIENEPHYRRGSRLDVPGIYIINAQLRHTGKYTCTAQTVNDKVSHSALIQVLGPPGECVGVIGTSTLERSILLTWLVGANHGSEIIVFNIEFHTNFNMKWRILKEYLPYAQVIDAQNSERCRLTLDVLKPGSSYQFRVTAINSYGSGPASKPSPYYRIVDAAPVVGVSDVREGSGSVGTLNIEWDELNPEDLTGYGVGYMVYFRRKENSPEGDKWISRRVERRANEYSTLVGKKNYFLEYEIMIGVFNSIGPGPNSSVYSVMSAEGIPTGTPTNVVGESVNATAVMVYWDPLPNTREYIRGRILGYQVNYWPWSAQLEDMNSVNIYCDCGEGLVQALDMNEDFWFNVQVFTRGGLGPMSEEGFGGTYIYPPLTYPEFVQVSSYPGNSVMVQWRGLNIGLLEETLTGYKMRWWPAHSDIRTANDTIVYDKMTYGIIEGLESGVVYALRVLGFSGAGDGKKSPTVYFTIEGQVLYNPETTDIMNTATHVHPCPSLHWTIVYLIGEIVVLFSSSSVSSIR